MGTSEDIARPVVFLASEYDGFITGASGRNWAFPANSDGELK